MVNRFAMRAGLATIITLAAGCGAPELTYRETSTIDAGTDGNAEAATQDARGDVATDTSRDVVTDTSRDVVTDTSRDVVTDTSQDVVTDTSQDVVTDTSQDVATDTSQDVATDTSQDVLGDTSTDAQPDTPSDVAPDTPTDAPDESDAAEACEMGMIGSLREDGTTFCIDATEVTEQAYAAWLATSPAPSTQQPPCLANDDFAPDLNACVDGSYTPSVTPDRPVTCVDWCDAFAFCEAAGKRLCGELGGGSVAYNKHQDPTKSQWMRACSANGTTQYPYSTIYQAGYCNGNDFGAQTAVNVGFAVDCIGAEAGLHDMSGNVAEWEDCCDGTANADSCRVRGGSYLDGSNELRCRSAASAPRNGVRAFVGFRCCGP